MQENIKRLSALGFPLAISTASRLSRAPAHPFVFAEMSFFIITIHNITEKYVSESQSDVQSVWKRVVVEE